MKPLFFTAALAVAAATLAAPAIVSAQEAEPPALVKMREPDPQNRQRVVKIKNLPSAIVAYTLDPKNNPRPVSLRAADKSDKADEKGTFDLPGSITQIVSIDPQNVLLIKGGSDEEFRRLQELIDVLDQPMRQVELEAQFVELSIEDAKTFGIDFSRNEMFGVRGVQGKQTPLEVQVGWVRNNVTARLNALVALSKAKVIAAPRLTALNNLTATVGANVEIGTLSDGKRAFTFEPVGAGLMMTPTINSDDTVTLLLNAVIKNGVEIGDGAIANVRDGDTIAIAGLSPLFAPVGVVNSPNVLVFITARIIRRAGDDIKVPGT